MTKFTKKRDRNKDSPPSRDHPAKKANTEGPIMSASPKPTSSSSPKPTTPDSADKTMSIGKDTPTDPHASPVISPNKSPTANLSNRKNGAGWSNNQDIRPKPLRHKFSELKNLECQVYTETIHKLSQVIDEEVDNAPVARSHEDKIRVITNIICARPGEMLLFMNASLRLALLDNLVTNKKALSETETAARFFQEDNLTKFVLDNTDPLANLFRKMADIPSSQDSELKNVLHSNCLEVANTFLTRAASLLKTKPHSDNFLQFCTTLRSVKPQKDAVIYMESHIRNMSFTETWYMALEDLPAGSPINSLQTVNDNVDKLAKKTEDLSLKVATTAGKLINTMDMVADIKSQEVASRQLENEHKVRLHNINHLANFREGKFQARLEIVTIFLNNLLGNRQFDVELITPRPNAKFFESLAIITFPTTGHKYRFEKEFSDFRKKTPTKLSCSRTKMTINKSDIFESEE